MRADSSIVVVGVAGDEITPLLGRLNERIAFYRGDGGKVHAFTAKQPANRKTVASGDNIEAGDFYPHASCNVLLISESRNIYRVTA